MAITLVGARFLGLAIERGCRLGDMLTVGRLGLYAPKARLNDVLARVDAPGRFDVSFLDPGLPTSGEYADDFYRHLGARSLHVMDGSAYEGADVIHDLNTPLPAELSERFDTVVDGGTLEHVFNPTEALSSYMKLVRPGGYLLLLDMPTTNLSGHGFYQFSPSLFWQALAPRHGFEVVEFLAADDRPFSDFWTVENPAMVKKRVELISDRPLYLYVLARKLGTFHGFRQFPIQDDYAKSWSETLSVAQAQKRRSPAALLRSAAAKLAPDAYWALTNERDYRRRKKMMRPGKRRKV